jgi:hypothetical protein
MRMDDRNKAISENGVSESLDVVTRQKRAAALLDAKLEHVAHSSHTDGLSSADHDQILYGSPRENRP